MKKKDLNKVKHIDLDSIKDPKFLKDLSYEELDLLSNDIRKKIIEVVSKNGGHLSSNLGVVELTIALHRIFDLSKDKLIFDVGHQCYAHKILTGRDITKLRTEDGVTGFPNMKESVYDAYEVGHSSTSISAANGFAIARDLNKENYQVIALIGDGSIVNGLALEALNNLSHSNHKVIIILNDNGMSISKPVGGLSKTFSNISTSKSYNRVKNRYSRIMNSTKVGKGIFNFTAKIKNFIKRILVGSNIMNELGYAYIGPIDGNNIKKIEKALNRAKNTKKSVIIHASTLKGKGYSFAENDDKGFWHGVNGFDIESGVQKGEPEGKISWSNVYSNITDIELNKHPESVLISPATIIGACLEPISEKYKDRIIDVGIAEEHAVTLASSLSLAGKHPILSIYSTFMQRAYDQISHDVARMNCDATFLVERAGLAATDGETHQGIYDEAYLSTIPNTVVTMPSNIDEAMSLYEESFNHHGPFFIRIPRGSENVQNGFNKVDTQFGKWMFLKETNKDLVVIGVGPLLRELEKEINKCGVECTLINALYVKPIDKSALEQVLQAKKIVIYDPYSTRGGLVDSVMAYLLEKQFKGAIKAYFIPNEFVSQGTIPQQLARYKITVEDVLKEIKQS